MAREFRISPREVETWTEDQLFEAIAHLELRAEAEKEAMKKASSGRGRR